MAAYLLKGGPLRSGDRRPKRPKIDVACVTCQIRKVRCDGVRPACGNCTKRFGRESNCQYNDRPPVKNGVRQQHLQLDNGNQRPPGDNLFASWDQPSSSAPQAQTCRPLLPNTYPGQMGTDAKPTIARNQRIAALSDTGSVPTRDARPFVNYHSTLIDDDVNTREFFISSSARSFIAQIKAGVASLLGQVQPQSFRSGRNMGAGNLNTRMHNSANNVLPPRYQADYLTNMYWFYIDPLFPILDRRKWEQNYTNLFSGTALDMDEDIFVVTLNVIFALSTQLDESMENRRYESAIYIKRARDLLDLAFWDSGSLESVQYLLLMGQYLQSTNLVHQGWMVVGAAVRAAQGLDLHLPETSARQPTPILRELFRRIWHCCVLMDRIVSISHGRPAMISRDIALAVPLPLTSSNAKPEQYGHLTEGSHFVKSVELFEIIHQVILGLYSEPGSRLRSSVCHDTLDENLATIMQLDSALVKWEESLPKFLMLNDPDVVNNDVSHRQALILQMNTLHARILLFRPMVARICLPRQGVGAGCSQTPESLRSGLMQQCTISCVDAARNTISLLLKYQASESTMRLLPSWWSRIYFLFSAATVLVAARLRTDIFDPQVIDQTWDEAIKALQAHERISKGARYYVTALQVLSSKILQGGGSPKDASTGFQSSTPAMQAVEGVQTGSISMQADNMHQTASQNQAFTYFQDLDIRDLTFTGVDLAWLNDMGA